MSTSARVTTPLKSKTLSLMKMGTCTLWPCRKKIGGLFMQSTDGIAWIISTTTSRKASGQQYKLLVKNIVGHLSFTSVSSNI